VLRSHNEQCVSVVNSIPYIVYVDYVWSLCGLQSGLATTVTMIKLAGIDPSQ
jgi:hypothetical protein